MIGRHLIIRLLLDTNHLIMLNPEGFLLTLTQA